MNAQWANLFLNTIFLFGVFIFVSLLAKLIMHKVYHAIPTGRGVLGLSWHGTNAAFFGLSVAWMAARFLPW